MRRIVPQILLVSMVAACGAFVPVVDLQELSPEQRQKIRSVQVLDDNLLSKRRYSILNVAEGNSCKNLVTDPPASRTNAIEQLKFYALEMGGNAISNIQCSGREGTSVDTNCWELISCTANVLIVR